MIVGRQGEVGLVYRHTEFCSAIVIRLLLGCEYRSIGDSIEKVKGFFIMMYL